MLDLLELFDYNIKDSLQKLFRAINSLYNIQGVR